MSKQSLFSSKIASEGQQRAAGAMVANCSMPASTCPPSGQRGGFQVANCREGGVGVSGSGGGGSAKNNNEAVKQRRGLAEREREKPAQQ